MRTDLTGRPWALLLAPASVALAIQAAPVALPDYQQFVAGAQRVQLLPGQKDFVFTIYGTPGNLEQLKQLVHVMKESME